jgi:hypothetical protein
MNDSEILKHLEKSAREDVKYFANPNKEERERWVVSEFLSALDVDFHEAEIISLEQDNKVDVCFRSAQFQIKELTDPNLRRGKMYKDALNSIIAATSLEEVSLISDVRDLPPVANMYELILDMASELANSEKYMDLKNEIDLLIYVTRTRASLIQSHELKREKFSALGWRSISCVNSKQAVVLHSSQTAPKFIVERDEQLMSNKG